MTGRITHGHTRGRSTSPEFRTWIAMRQRCGDPKHAKFKTYGARGICVCPIWQESFEQFLADMGPRPAGHTLDRLDNNGNYEPGNCRWATPKQQAENRAKSSFDTNSRKTHCPAGHAYAGKNVRVSLSGRKCRECERIRAHETRKKAAKERSHATQ